MSAAQHTPGPWWFNEAAQTIVSNQSHPIARLTEPFHRQCANGRTGNDGPLLGAAPELLSALRLAVEKLESMGLGGSVECKRMRAAISKATGGTP